jgi:uncharacterized membrane protein
MDSTMILIMTMVYALFMGFDFIPVYRGKNTKLIWLYLSLLICSFSITILIGFGVKVPSPAPPIKKIITPFIQGGKR